MPHDKTPRISEGLPRREFLRIGTIGIVAGALTPNIFAKSRAARNPGGEPLLSVGYAEKIPAAGESEGLQAASSTLAGDPAFIRRGARLSIESFSRAAKYRDTLSGGAAIDVVYPANSYTPDHLPRFRAWSFAGREEGDTASGPIAFDVPVTATDGVQLVIRRMNLEVAETVANTPRGGALSDESSAVLSLGSDSRSAKLQRGAYVIAFREGFDDVVTSWNLFSLSNRAGQFVVTPAPFTYLVMTIDYAK